jgi:hypothetical protein
MIITDKTSAGITKSGSSAEFVGRFQDMEA